MMTYNKYYIGILIFLVSVSIIYINYSNELRMRIDTDKSVFYIYESGWKITGTEYNKLYNGTKLVNRRVSSISIKQSYDTIHNTSVITRIVPYQNNAKIIDTYKFDGKTNDKENFPVSHTVELLDAKGLLYQYEIRDLFYDGDTMFLPLEQTSMNFGKNMKVTWQSGNYYAKIIKLVNGKAKLIIKYRIESNYEKLNTRLFDPAATITIFSPTNTTYELSQGQTNTNIDLNWTSDNDLSWCSYSLNGTENKTSDISSKLSYIIPDAAPSIIDAYAQEFNFSQDVYLKNISIYIHVLSDDYTFVIYNTTLNDSAMIPDGSEVVNMTTVIFGSAGWNTLNYTDRISLKKDTTYTLYINSSIQVVDLWYDSATHPSYRLAQTNDSSNWAFSTYMGYNNVLDMIIYASDFDCEKNATLYNLYPSNYNITIFGNSTDNVMNSTIEYFTVDSVDQVRLYLNGSSSDRYYEQGTYANLTAIYYYANGTVCSNCDIWIDIDQNGYGDNYTTDSDGIVQLDFRTFSALDEFNDSTNYYGAGRQTRTFGWSLNDSDDIESITINITPITNSIIQQEEEESYSCVNHLSYTGACDGSCICGVDGDWSTRTGLTSLFGIVGYVYEDYNIPTKITGANITTKLGREWSGS